jgi:hypothetical protein
MVKSKLFDRRSNLFGRHQDIDHLIRRTKLKGLTAVVSRPQMGKTWLLTHVAWQLSENNCLVGYEESVGQGGDLILRAVANLYTFWLSNATYREQAKSLFQRHKDELISSVGRAVGAMVEPLSKTVGLEALGKRSVKFSRPWRVEPSICVPADWHFRNSIMKRLVSSFTQGSLGEVRTEVHFTAFLTETSGRIWTEIPGML